MSMPCTIVHTYSYSSWEAEAVVFRFPQDIERACLDHTTAWCLTNEKALMTNNMAHCVTIFVLFNSHLKYSNCTDNDIIHAFSV